MRVMRVCMVVNGVCVRGYSPCAKLRVRAASRIKNAVLRLLPAAFYVDTAIFLSFEKQSAKILLHITLQ